MGNSATKEQRPPPPQSRSSQLRPSTSPSVSNRGSSFAQNPADAASSLIYSSRHGRGSRPEISSILGFPSAIDRESTGIESRRETKQEREARKLEKERNLRGRERERSMRGESVDGGFLVTQGVYTGIEDYNKIVVRQLMVCLTTRELC